MFTSRSVTKYKDCFNPFDRYQNGHRLNSSEVEEKTPGRGLQDDENDENDDMNEDNEQDEDDVPDLPPRNLKNRPPVESISQPEDHKGIIDIINKAFEKSMNISRETPVRITKSRKNRPLKVVGYDS